MDTAETMGATLEDRGTAKDGSSPHVRDLGWDDPDDASDYLVPGLPNEELWILLRRFNKQTYHVKSVPKNQADDLDLEIVSDEVFTPVKFKTHLERLYMTVIVGAFHLWKHITRLRSWREWRRTLTFLTAYTIAWSLDCLLASVLLFMAVLIMFPSSRSICFPPAPPSLIDGTTGGVKKPDAGVLGSGDSLTGAPEKYPGEAVEQEAHSAVNSVITLAVGLAGDMNPEDIGDVKYKTGNVRSVQQDKTKKPVADAVFREAATVSHLISRLADTYERFGNALNPIAPFPQQRPRVVLASCLFPLILVLQLLSAYALMKGLGFLFGVLIFGDPVWRRTADYLDRNLPDWRSRISPRNTIFHNVPTNIQLALTLLRIAEANHAPLPPAPGGSEPPQMEVPPGAETGLGDTLGIDQQEVNLAMQPDDEKKAEAEDKPQAHMSKKHSRIMGFVKGLVKGGVNSGLAADRATAHMGLEKAKFRAGVVRTGPRPQSGPEKFPARFEGKKGHVIVNTLAKTPTISWVSESGDPKWALGISEISEIQKIGGLGWKTKIAVSWATEDEVQDGLLIRGATGDEVHLTAMPSRDELFNRLVAIGTQAWGEW
ncbi:hypothetical protein QBC34DRAFT_361865 [Podospora aff. communis PSN243]|uniref:Peroxin domain-containing protein n=1 Tax=Podospora aff. communis PSN243 TaxID=3040156 RepID=A0AAV9G543_9PEZI|nr:hypothetical protein QBC34DRAFT_361865 [Podospora aff. communis PSN243]